MATTIFGGTSNPAAAVGNLGAGVSLAGRARKKGPPERGQPARSRAGADVRAAHGVHTLRDHRRRRPPELARAAGAREPERRPMAVSHYTPALARRIAGAVRVLDLEAIRD
jgi:hypothetical protein